MNARATGRQTPLTSELRRDIARGEHLWRDCRERRAAAGPWLFGEYTMADAMYAPVVLRLRTYGAEVSPATRQYMATVLVDAHLQEWLTAAAAAAAEPWTADTEAVGL